MHAARLWRRSLAGAIGPGTALQGSCWGWLGTMEPPGLHLALLRQLLRGLRQQGPSPASRTPPGYLRAFTAEAVPQVAAEEAAAAAAAARSSAAATAEAAPAAVAAADALQGGASKEQTKSTLNAFLGLTNVLQQQQAQMAGQHTAERLSPALRAMMWHQRYMDDTPAGRELRRNWQRQVGWRGGQLERAGQRAPTLACMLLALLERRAHERCVLLETLHLTCACTRWRPPRADHSGDQGARCGTGALPEGAAVCHIARPGGGAARGAPDAAALVWAGDGRHPEGAAAGEEQGVGQLGRGVGLLRLHSAG